jgi:peptidoglycan hydrolase-like protein with peptidoglycan-binding domain
MRSYDTPPERPRRAARPHPALSPALPAAGNRALAARLARSPAVIGNRRPATPGPLTAAEEDEAVEAGDRRLDGQAIRAVQALVGRPPTGALVPEDAQAIALFKRAHGAGRDGVVDEPALSALIAEAARSDMHDEAIHAVVRFYRLDTASTVLSIRFDASLSEPANVSFEGPLQTVLVGPRAFASAAALRSAIAAQLATPNPLAFAQPPPAWIRGMPHVLHDGDVADAVAFDRARLRDHRAVVALQIVVGADLTGAVDEQTVQFTARFQAARRLVPADGKVGPATFDAVFAALVALQDFGAAIRLALDYHRIGDPAVLDVGFDPALTEVCETRGIGTGAPVTLTFGPDLFAGPVPDSVHKLASFYARARARMAGGLAAHAEVRDFLGAAVEVLSRGMRPEDFGDRTSGFVADAANALARFQRMAPDEQKAFWSRFEEVRDKVRERFAAADPAVRHPSEALLRDYERVVRPR